MHRKNNQMVRNELKKAKHHIYHYLGDFNVKHNYTSGCMKYQAREART